MARWAAFLRGMNLGKRRITNDELVACFDTLGFDATKAFLASGNVTFESRARSAAKLVTKIEKGLEDLLGYAVPTFVRTEAELRALADAPPLPRASKAGKLQVMLLKASPPARVRQRVLVQSSAADGLAFGERALFWLPEGPLSRSVLDLRAIEKGVGPMTTRTHGTLVRLVKKHFGSSLLRTEQEKSQGADASVR